MQIVLSEGERIEGTQAGKVLISTPSGRIRSVKLPSEFANVRPSTNASPGDRGFHGAYMTFKSGDRMLSILERPVDPDRARQPTEQYHEGAVHDFEDDFEDDA